MINSICLRSDLISILNTIFFYVTFLLSITQNNGMYTKSSRKSDKKFNGTCSMTVKVKTQTSEVQRGVISKKKLFFLIENKHDNNVHLIALWSSFDEFMFKRKPFITPLILAMYYAFYDFLHEKQDIMIE